LLPIITNRKIRVGLVGCGRIAENHLKAINAMPDDLELIAIADSEKAIVDKVSKEQGVPGFGSIAELLKAVKIDLVILCTPSGLHPAQAIMAAKHGVNVMTEKPMATRWRDGLEMVKACDEASVRLFVVKQNRFNSTLQLLRRAVNEGRFGKIYMVSINVFWCRPQEYYDSAAWRGTWELDGGAFMNQASHYIDLVDWLIGPVETVHAFTGTLARRIEVEDSGVMNIRWRSGTLGSISVTMLSYLKNLEGSITILGEKGTVRLGGVAVNEIQHWDFADKTSYDEDIKSANYETTSVYGFGHPAYYKNMVEVFRGTADPHTDGREGLKSLELLIAGYMSARDGRTVALPLEY
jgi:UDP-N-acetyl-2-amino-2-deoxyglucuronate dehydrogenase